VQAVAAEASGFDPTKFPEPLDENDHLIGLRKCSFKRGRLIPSGDITVLNIKEAVALLAPTRKHYARVNVLKLKPGQFIGVKAGDLSNFVIVNPTTDGDIRWLLKTHPDLPVVVRDIYRVESVDVRRNTIDLPSESSNGDHR